MRAAIRQARKDEAHLLATIIRDSFRDVAERFEITRENCPNFASNCTAEWVHDDMDKGITYYVLEHQGQPCGCGALDLAQSDRWPTPPPGRKPAYLKRLAVLPEHRRIAFGKALVEHILNEAKTSACHRVQIGIVAEHTELRDWYEKLGFFLEKTAHFQGWPFTVAFMFIDL